MIHSSSIHQLKRLIVTKDLLKITTGPTAKVDHILKAWWDSRYKTEHFAMTTAKLDVKPLPYGYLEAIHAGGTRVCLPGATTSLLGAQMPGESGFMEKFDWMVLSIC